MENATKAMFIAAGVLMGVMILSLGATLFASLGSYIESSQEQIRFNELNKFNTQFTNYINYIGNEKQFELTIQDIVTVANLAYENNKKNDLTSRERGNQSNAYVAVYLDGRPIEENITKNMADLLDNNTLKNVKQYKCEPKDVKISKITGKVYAIYFSEEK